MNGLPTDDELLAHLCAKSLRTFIEEAWPIIEPGTTFKPGQHIDAICDQLERVTAGECLRLIVNVPPRHMKSLIISVAWPAWVWLTCPEKRFLCASYAQGLAIDDNVKCRTIVQSVGGQEVGGLFERVGYQGVLSLLGQSWTLTDDQNEKKKFTNDRRGYRAATSVGGTVTGLGGDVIVLDDPNNADDAHSEAARLAVRNWLDGTLSTRLNDPAKGAIVVVQQRVHKEDATGHLVTQGGWEHVCLPAEFEAKHPHVWDGDWRTEPGELLWPEHYGRDALEDLKRRMPPAVRPGQLQQRPTAAEGGMFKRTWWKNRWREDLEGTLSLGWDQIVQSWDMRFKDDKVTGDYVVGQLWGFHGADAYLLGQVRQRLSFTESVQAVKDMTVWSQAGSPLRQLVGVPAVLIEEKANGAAILDTLRREREIGGLISVDPKGSKQARAAAVTPMVESGNVWLPASSFIPCPPGYEATAVGDFVEEHAAFPVGGVHDDQVDALSQVLAWKRPQARDESPVRPQRVASPLAAGITRRAL